MSISSFISCRHHQTTRYIPLYNIVLVLSLCSQVWLLSLRAIWRETPFIVFIEQLFCMKKVFLKEPNPQMSCVQFTSAFFHESHSGVEFTCTLFRENASILPPTYLPTYPSTYLPTYLCTHLAACPSTYLPTYLPTYLLAYLPTHPPANLPTYLPTCPPTILPTTYLPIYVPACQYLAGTFSRADHHFSCKTCSRTLTSIFCISLMREQCALF